MKKKKFKRRDLIVRTIGLIIMIIVLCFCFVMIRNINLLMNSSAASNLLNTTKVIESNLQNYINKDLSSLEVVGDIYVNSENVGFDEITAITDTLGFEWIGIVDSEGNGLDCFKNNLNITDVLNHDEWEPEQSGYSNAYFGNSGRLQITLWEPFYEDGEWAGTVFGYSILTKYYTTNVFTFYEGEGRTYLFNGDDGSWILRSLGVDGAGQRKNDLYSLLESSGNSTEDINNFQQAITQRQTGTAVLDFNGEKSYICFMPLSSSDNWYIATVIAKDVLLKESSQVQNMIRMIFIIFCLALGLFAYMLMKWNIRSAKLKEIDYREKLFANISSNIDSAFIIYEKATQQTAFVSDNVKRLLGIEREYLRKNISYLFDWCNIDENNKYRQAFLNGKLEKAEIHEVCVSDMVGTGKRYIRLELIPGDLGQEIAVLTDITSDKEIQTSLIETMKRAEDASRAKNDFLSSMSHDIRTPMNGIVGMTNIAAANLDDKNRVKDCLEKISDASDHLLNLINEILDMSQIESGKVELAVEPFNLAELLQNVLSMNYAGIQQKNHVLKTYIHSMEHECVIGDSIRLQRIINNLLSNAIKYTPEGGLIKLSLQEKASIIKGYGCYELIVSDNGIGMSEEFQQRLFQPFEREEDVRTSRIQGTGLGMSIVKNMVTLMMGNIQVESKKNVGSTFTVTINLRLDEPESNIDNRLKGHAVLVVDDDVITCETVTSMLNEFGMIGEWASSGEDALVKIKQRHLLGNDYTAILLDWRMPGMDGIETAKHICQDIDDSIPLIILTAYDWSEVEEKAKEVNISAFMEKPIYKSKLKQRMISFIIDSSEMSINETNQVKKVLTGKHVLLVEDNDLNLEIAKEVLQAQGMIVDTAVNGVYALKSFSESELFTYDFILMDIQMPEMNGYQATKAIRALDRVDSKTVPIVAMTADAFTKDVQMAYEAGMNEHLSKPISVDRLMQVLVRFSASKENDEKNETKN